MFSITIFEAKIFLIKTCYIHLVTDFRAAGLTNYSIHLHRQKSYCKMKKNSPEAMENVKKS